MKRINFIVVVYSVAPSLCSTIRSLISVDFSKYNIFPTFSIWDNSDKGFGMNSLPSFPGDVIYNHAPGNEKLSVLYNDFISRDNSFGYYVFLDDDSVLGEGYFSALDEFFSSGVFVAVPVIEYCDNIISPGYIVGVRGRRYDRSKLSLGVNVSKGMVAMMSGTVVSSEVFKSGLRFDERLSFYCVDTKFFIDYSSRYAELFVLNYSMGHKSALRDVDGPIAQQLARHRNLILSRAILFDKNFNTRLSLLAYTFFYVVKLALARRSFRYLFLLRELPSIFIRKAD